MTGLLFWFWCGSAAWMLARRYAPTEYRRALGNAPSGTEADHHEYAAGQVRLLLAGAFFLGPFGLMLTGWHVATKRVLDRVPERQSFEHEEYVRELERQVWSLTKGLPSSQPLQDRP